MSPVDPRIEAETLPPSYSEKLRQRSGASPPTADLILNNGKIVTLDTHDTIAQAIAIMGDRILAVGPNAAMVELCGPETQVTDLNQKTVVPGLTDGHAHMDRWALRNIFPSLGRTHSIRDIQDRIAELASKAAPGEWIVTMPIGDPPYYFGVPDNLAERRWPTRAELDAAAPNNPVYIRAIWGYWRGTFPLVSCANTSALARAGITRDTISPIATVTIEKDANGDPTGVIVEQEMQPVAELIWFRQAAGFTHADRLNALPASASAYHSFGTTGVFEGHGVANELLRVYQQAHQQNLLTMRSTLSFSPNWKVVENVRLGAFIDSWAGWLSEPGFGDDRLKMSGLHVMVGRQAGDELRATAAPYTGWAGFNYATGLPPKQLSEVLLHCAANDIRVVMNGAPLVPSAENVPVLDLYEEVNRQIPLRGKRWAIYHIDTLSARDLERIVCMGLVLTTHTNLNLYKRLHVTAARLAPDRHNEIVPLRSLVKAGVNVSLATDNAPISLFLPIWQSIARTSYHTRQQVAPEEALSRTDALRCATTHGAYLTFDESKRGSLEPGKLADLAVLSDDPLTTDEINIPNIRSLLTVVGGRTVHKAQDWQSRPASAPRSNS
jgi:predicted amidohydrolase YtcJ